MITPIIILIVGYSTTAILIHAIMTVGSKADDQMDKLEYIIKPNKKEEHPL